MLFSINLILLKFHITRNAKQERDKQQQTWQPNGATCWTNNAFQEQNKDINEI